MVKENEFLAIQKVFDFFKNPFQSRNGFFVCYFGILKNIAIITIIIPNTKHPKTIQGEMCLSGVGCFFSGVYACHISLAFLWLLSLIVLLRASSIVLSQSFWGSISFSITSSVVVRFRCDILERWPVLIHQHIPNWRQMASLLPGELFAHL